MTKLFPKLPGVLVLLICLALPVLAQNRLVNMVPNSRSGETNQDAEPTITVDPNNFDHMAGSAFTWDNLTQGPMVTATAPIYVTTDGGHSWTLAFIVPSSLGSGFPTGDITLSFSSTPSGAVAHSTSWLYGGILSSTAASRPMTPLRSQDPFSSALMATLDTRSGNVDQPHTIAKTASGGVDRLYVGFNNGYGCVAPGGRSGTVDTSQDANAATPTMTLELAEDRNTACQDGFATVPAAHKDGTVYVAFIHDWSGTPRLVVVRDDNWGNSATPFTALIDPSDSVAGRFVTVGLTLPSGEMGQNRLGASNVSIAVDPNNSDRVYLAWGDSNGSNSETIHVRRSINRGNDWSADLLTVTSAMNPEVAINDMGIVGVLYQSVVSGNWETHLVLSNNLDASSFGAGILLATQNASTPLASYWPYIGDYASLAAAGYNFVGIFSASNFPDQANFMSGVKYQREVDWTAHKLYADAAHTTEVSASIDPFFFDVPTSACNRSRFFCNICARDPRLCYPIYDPWWWLKCPACGFTIFVDPGEEYEDISVYDSLGKEVGQLERLREPIIEKGTRYTHAIRLRTREGVGYVLKAKLRRENARSTFRPSYFVRVEGKERE